MFKKEEALNFIANAEQYSNIINEKLPPDLTVDEVIGRMRDNVAICRNLMDENNRFIDSNLKPVFADPAMLTKTQAEELLWFARSLHNPIYSNEDERTRKDSFLALDVYRALGKWAEKTHETEHLVKCWFGIGDIFYLLAGSLYSHDSVYATRKALELVEKAGGYFALKDKNARRCAAACYNQLAISVYNSRDAGYKEKFKAIDKALEFYNRDDVKEFDRDFPWQSWIDDVNGNIEYMGIHYEFMTSIGPITPDLAERVYNFNRAFFSKEELARLDSYDDEVCEKFIEEAINSPESEKWMHSIYCIICAFHSGHIDKERYVKQLRFCLDAHTAVFRVSSNFLTELARYDMVMVISAILARYTKDHNIGVSLFDYLHKLPRVILDALSSSKEELKTVAENTLDETNRYSYIDVLLTSTTHNHLPTYVHSMMVSHLMACFVSWFLDNKPEKLIGMCGSENVDDVIAKRTSILEETRLAGLAHDIGKIAYIQAVSVISRRLTDSEFALIKRHTDEGRYYLEGKDFGCIPDVVRGHQKTHDGKSGYPVHFDNTKSPYQFMIDICSAADSIDAATDDIGRSYQQCKSGDVIMDEIISQSPSRYNPLIADSLKDIKLRESINTILHETRQVCYYKAYCEFSG